MSRFAVDLSSAALRAECPAHVAWLRESVGPVLPSTRPDGLLVLSAELVREVLTDPARYSSSIMATADPELLGADGAAHRAVRRTLVRALRDADACAVRAAATGRADRLLGAFARAGGGDAVPTVARPLAVLAAAGVLGMPVPDVRRLTGWAAAAVGSATGGDGADVAAHSAAATATVAARLPAAGRGVLGALRAGVDAGEQTKEGAVAVALLVLLASLDTTTALVAGCLRAVAAGAAGTPEGVVEGVLAAHPPVRFVRRVATAPSTLGGVPLRPGQPVLAHLHSANAEAGGFAFGAGPHACPGAAVARAVAVGAVTAAARYALRPAGEPVPQRSSQIAGWAALPLHAGRRP
ncbi:hypothetical protein GCM10010123_39080 [Pilimelia anulata]|uniref:Cytochrome P450 n=1 Tax=Pilimelia anulata TaxID=53371 RepID=A0A8J3B9G3_9ACTN|nr:cytochrome P450 [Pilimelia anulata]GGK05401.1 hypothetical protein GCM10010123_39080 [Pilimelia anulata]